MKKYYYLVLAIGLGACNNDSKPAEGSPAKTPAPQTAAATSTGSGDCGSLVLFRKGAIIEAVSYDASGKESSRQTTTVTDVSSGNGMTLATATAASTSSLGNHTNTMQYKCDGKNLYMDLNAMMQNFKALKDAKADVQNLSFPIQMSEGETLPEASFTVSMDRGGKKMDIKTTYKNRTVGPKEKVATPAGSWDCFKVNADIDSEVQGMDEATKKIMDAVRQKTKMQMVMWIAPGFGMVKMEMLMNGKRSSYTEITSVK